MARIMFPFASSESEERFRQRQAEKAAKQWKPTGFFKDIWPMSRHEVARKASNTRMWLEYILHDGPKPAKEVLRLAKLEGFSEWGVRRAKRHHGIKSTRSGGKGTGRRNPWLWQFPSTVYQTD